MLFGSFPFSKMIISPASTSLIKVAPTASNAQVSLETIYPPLSLPIESGFNPFLSLHTYNLFFVKIRKA
jgi:hypothetical protein